MMGRPFGSGVVSFEDRFWRYVSPMMDDQGCWEWTGSRMKTKWPYGKFGRGQLGSGWMHAHRASWIVHFGEVSDGMCVLHRCDNPPCVNPSHLFLGTFKDNTQDMIAKGRARMSETILHAIKAAAAIRADARSTRTHCPHGHDWQGNNVKRGRNWVCRTCERIRQRAYWASHREVYRASARRSYQKRKAASCPA